MSDALFTPEDLVLLREAVDLFHVYAQTVQPEARRIIRERQALDLGNLQSRIQHYLDQQSPVDREASYRSYIQAAVQEASAKAHHDWIAQHGPRVL